MQKKTREEKNEITASRFPHRQLFKPQTIIEKIFVVLSVLSVIVAILSNAIAIDDSLRAFIPRIIYRNFNVIMHAAHIALIVYVIVAMTNMLELIPNIDLKAAKTKREGLTRKWNSWIRNYVNIRPKPETTGSGEEGFSTGVINGKIEIANENLNLFYKFWVYIWIFWLVMYIGMFVSTFVDKNNINPNHQLPSVNYENVISPSRGKMEKNTVVFSNDSVEYMHEDLRDKPLYIVRNPAEGLTPAMPVYYFDLPGGFSVMLNDTMRIVSDSVQMFNTFDLPLATAGSRVYEINTARFINPDSIKASIVKGLEVSEFSVSPVKLTGVYIDGNAPGDRIVNMFIFFENTVGIAINVLFFWLYYILAFRYSREDRKEKFKFNIAKAITIFIGSAIVVIDFISLFCLNSDIYKTIMQLVILGLCSILMFMLFSQMNNGYLRICFS